MGSDVLAPDDGEGLHDVIHVVSGDAVNVEERRVEFGSDREAPLLIPLKWQS